MTTPKLDPLTAQLLDDVGSLIIEGRLVKAPRAKKTKKAETVAKATMETGDASE